MNTNFVKVGSALQDKLIVANKQNEVNRQKLMRELTKLEVAKRSDVRMLETFRQRFRLRHRKFEARTMSSVSDAIDVRMYETHNPGFCYHCTGTIKAASGLSTAFIKEKTRDDYEVVRSMLFTNGEVDPDKILCLHLLTAHSVRSNEFDTIESITSLLEKGKKKHRSRAWNHVLPCYILDVHQDPDCIEESSENMKIYRDPCLSTEENETICSMEFNHRQNSKNNADVSATVQSTDDKRAKMISSDLESCRNFTAKQFTMKKLKRSSMDFDPLQDEKNLSFLNYQDDNTSIKDSTLQAATSRSSILKSPSKKSEQRSNYKFDYSITMLKPNSGNREAKKLVSTKPNHREIASKIPSTTSTFRNTVDDRWPLSTDLLVSRMASPVFEIYKTCRRRVYLNSPIKCHELRDREYRIVPILVNNQIQALVKSILQVLTRANPGKMKRIVEVARDPREMKKMLIRPDIQLFVESLSGQSLISSFENFVVSTATLVDEIEPRFERALRRELMALTMEMPSVSNLNLLVSEIRSNIFSDLKQLERLGKKEKINEIENSKDECLWDREDREENLTELSFDFNEPCSHAE